MPSGGLLVRARYSWRRRRCAVEVAMTAVFLRYMFDRYKLSEVRLLGFAVILQSVRSCITRERSQC